MRLQQSGGRTRAVRPPGHRHQGRPCRVYPVEYIRRLSDHGPVSASIGLRYHGPDVNTPTHEGLQRSPAARPLCPARPASEPDGCSECLFIRVGVRWFASKAEQVRIDLVSSAGTEPR